MWKVWQVEGVEGNNFLELCQDQEVWKGIIFWKSITLSGGGGVEGYIFL